MNRIVARSSAGILLVLLALVAYTQNQPPKLTLNKVKDDLFEIEGDGGNVGVYVTSDGVILIDDKFDQDHDAILATVKEVTSQPVKYVISTHSHGDHSGGNAKMFSIGAEIVSTSNARKNIIEKKQYNAPPGVMPARIVFTDETSVFLGGKEVRAHYFGRGHTNGDAMIYFPALRVVHTGDLFTGTPPFIDFASGGSAVEWTKTLDNLLQSGWDFDTVIPGHGPVSKKEDILKYRSNFETMRNRVSSMIREGKSKEEISKTLVNDFRWVANGNPMRQLDAMLAELTR
jgi:cyclase